MSIVYHERPGVYSDVDASRIYASGIGAKVVGLVGLAEAARGLYTITDSRSGVQAFGIQSQLGRMLQLCYQNGAGTVVCSPVVTDSETGWRDAIELLVADHTCSYICVGSDQLAVHTILKTAVEEASAERGECIGLVGMGEADVTALTARAGALNSERMVLVAPAVYLSGESTVSAGCMAAAALAGVLSCQADPALPLNGQVLHGIGGLTALYSDTEIDALVRGGVTPLEMVSGACTVLRGITTRTKTGQAEDLTWRELTTTMIIDEVIPAIRSSLRAKFVRAKNTAATRAAIRSQVVIALEDRMAREIIDGYDTITVRPDTADPTVCVVEFGFTVAHGLNRIHLMAHISV